MEGYILISYLNDFVFCPISIYFHQLYGDKSTMMYQALPQINGMDIHSAIDDGRYSTRKNVLQGMEIYSSKYNICGKIDVFDVNTGLLTERKKKIKKIYDGYVFQMYAQYYCLEEMGYIVNELRLYSSDDNKNYKVDLPKNNKEMSIKFDNLIDEINNFDISSFMQTNIEKCKGCIYEPACDRTNL